MTYDQDLGAPDATGRYIEIGDRIVVGSNKGLRVGVVLAVKSSQVTGYTGNFVGYTYSVTVTLEMPVEKRQTFPHDTMGPEKFWVIT